MHKSYWKDLATEGPLVALAPMDGYCDSPYRQIVKKLAPQTVVFSEFYSADGLVHSKDLAKKVLVHDPSEHPLVIQIFGKDPEKFRESAIIIESYGITGITGAVMAFPFTSAFAAGIVVPEGAVAAQPAVLTTSLVAGSLTPTGYVVVPQGAVLRVRGSVSPTGQVSGARSARAWVRGRIQPVAQVTATSSPRNLITGCVQPLGHIVVSPFAGPVLLRASAVTKVQPIGVVHAH